MPDLIPEETDHHEWEHTWDRYGICEICGLDVRERHDELRTVLALAYHALRGVWGPDEDPAVSAAKRLYRTYRDRP